MGLLRFIVIMVCLGGMAQGYAFNLGVITERADQPDHALEQYSLLNDYLAERLEQQGLGSSQLKVAANLEQMHEFVERGEVDAVVEGVMPTLKLERVGQHISPELLVWRKGQRQYHSVFLTRKDSAVNNLEDIRGKTIIFEAPRSTSAFFVPSIELVAQGLKLHSHAKTDPEHTIHTADHDQSVSYVFAGSELNQVYWLMRGKGEVAAFNNGDWERTPIHLREQLKIIHKTQPLLRWLFSFHGQVPEKTRQAVVSILLDMHQQEDGQAALEAASGISKFEMLNESDIESLQYWRTNLERFKAQ